jgi:cobalamin-dependent methionine synthase I
MILTYNISEIRPYINWIYFFHSWGLTGKPEAEKEKLKADAERKLDEWEGHFHTHAAFEILDANSDGDDLLLGAPASPCCASRSPHVRVAPTSAWPTL